MSSKTLFVRLVPEFKRLRNERVYTEAQVKNILCAFARDLGCKWSESRLTDFIESVFDFDNN